MIDILFGWILDFISEIVDKDLGAEGAFRVFLLLAASVMLTILAYNWKSILHGIPRLRRIAGVDERVVGAYIQPIYNSEIGLRYTILNIQYVGIKSGYRIIGRSYSKDGSYFASFESDYFKLHAQRVLEFVWRGREETAPITLGGYTRLEFELLRKGRYQKGRGFVVDFTGTPRTNTMMLERLRNHPADEQEFVKEFDRDHGERIKQDLLRNNAIAVDEQ